MIHFNSKGVLPIYTEWLSENKDAIDSWIDSARTGSAIWSELGKTFGQERETTINPKKFRKAVEQAFWLEQNGLCCYCGDKIDLESTKKYHSIEHWQPKNVFKERIFDWNNLFLTCRESNAYKKYTIDGVTIKTVADISRDAHLSPYIVLKYNEGKQEKKGEVWEVPRPAHCDDSKSKYDSKKLETQLPIIYPPDAQNYSNYIVYNKNGEIEVVGSPSKADKVLLENTIEVLALNCITLVDRRRNIWENTLIDWDILLEEDVYLIEDEDYMRTTLNTFKEATLNIEEGEMQAFYFVIFAAYESLENAYS